MTIERREEYAEVVSSDAADVRSVDVSTSGPAGTTTHQTETSSSDPYAARRDLTRQSAEAHLLAVRDSGGVAGHPLRVGVARRQPGCGLCAVHLQHHQPVHRPVRWGCSGQARFGGSVFDVNTLVAILVYALIAWVLVKIVWLVMGDSRRGVRTTSSQLDTRVR